jgi:formate hydrogenlyase subunit 4
MTTPLTAALLVLGQTALIVLVAPLLNGVIAALRARLQMRRGAPPWQRYSDLARLWHKEAVVSEDASWLARVVPGAVLACSLAVCTWTPVLLADDPFGFAGDLVALVAMFAAVRALLALLAMEPGTAFGGMAASRHLALSALAEPALMLSVFTLALGAHTTALGGIARAVATAPLGWLSPSHLLALAAVGIVVIAETGRVPVDNPVTHLELTMIHEGLVLDVSGRHLALLEWAAALRQTVLLTIVASLFLPWGIALAPTPGALALAAVAWLAKLLAACVIIAVMESVNVRMRLFRVPEFLGMAFLLSVLALASDAMLR